jgi:hypothetical protein
MVENSVHRRMKFERALGELIDLAESAVQAALVIVNVQPELEICLTAMERFPACAFQLEASGKEETYLEYCFGRRPISCKEVDWPSEKSCQLAWVLTLKNPGSPQH